MLVRAIVLKVWVLASYSSFKNAIFEDTFMDIYKEIFTYRNGLAVWLFNALFCTQPVALKICSFVIKAPNSYFKILVSHQVENNTITTVRFNGKE